MSFVIFNCRFTVREEKKKTQKCDLLCGKCRLKLRKKEENSIKEDEINPQCKNTIGAQNITLAIIRENEVNLSLGKISYL